MSLELLISEAKGMSDVALMEGVHYMRYLKITAGKNLNIDNSNNKKNKYRMAGKYKGKGWMADDFDAPIDDFKEYM